MSSQLYTPDLHAALERANTAWRETWDALLALAEALTKWNSCSVPDPKAEVKAALDRAEDEKEQAQEALVDLEDAKETVPTPAEARGTLGDEDDEELRNNAEKFEEAAKELEEQKERAKQWQRWLQAGHGVALVLMALCGALLSFDAIRAGLGVAEDNHVLLAVGAVAVSCQVAAQALATSWQHLHAAARQHRDKAQDLRDRAERVKIARDNADTAAATRGKITRVLRVLREVTQWLGKLVAAVNVEEATPGQRLTAAENKLENILSVLGKASGRHGVMAQKLEEIWSVPGGQGVGTQRGHGGGAVTRRDTGDLLALGTPGAP